MKRLFQFGWMASAAIAAAMTMLALMMAPPASAQRYLVRQGPRVQARRAERQQRQAQRQVRKQENKPGVRGAMGLPPKWMDKLQQMSPEEQEKFMRNNKKFQNLPPERQEQIRRRLQTWNQLSPQQKDALINRERIFSRLSPEERQEVVQDLAPRWKALPPERKQLLTGRMHVLAGMTAEQRQAALEDSQFMRGLDTNEQDLLRKLTDLRLGPPDGQ